MQIALQSLLTIAIVLVSKIDAQVDSRLCPNGPILSSDPPWHHIPSRFEIVTELVDSGDVAELSQAFSSRRDAIAFTSRGNVALFYWNFETNEQFQVLQVVVENEARFACFREVINSSTSQTSTIQQNTLLVKPSVLLGYDSRNQVNSQWGVMYIADSTVRGIPTNVFKSCFYVSDIRATVSATYQVSDVNRFHAYLPSNQSVILEINVQVAAQNGENLSYTYNVFRYMPNPTGQDVQQALETPAGVFCPNRTNTLAVPSNLPERFSVNNEVLIPEASRSIFSANQLFDKSVQFTRFEIWVPNQSGSSVLHMTDLHDFGTGLIYQYNHQTHQCKIDEIRPGMGDTVGVDGQPNLVQMIDGSHLLLLDDMMYQYTGEKKCRDRVWCHVWVSEKQMPNNTGFEHREWYWAFRINDEALQQWIPMKFILHVYNPLGKAVASSESNLFNFRRDPSTIFEIDYTMADCYRAMGPEANFNLGVISFTVANDRGYPVQKNIDYLRYQIWQTLSLVLQVRLIRISNIIVDHDGKDLPVTLTLLDVPPHLGPVEFPLQEISFTTAIARLRTVIDSNALAFRAKNGNTEVTLRARINSLQVIHTSFDQNVDQCVNQTFAPRQTPADQCLDTTTDQNLDQNIEITYKRSGPLITGLWIGFIILGVLIGIVGGSFALRRFLKQ